MADLADLGSTTRGIWTRRQALEVVSRGQLQGLLRNGQWRQLWPGVYGDSGYEPDAEQRAIAAVLASGEEQPTAPGRRILRAVACGRTAARLHGLPLIDDHDPATGARDHLVDDVAVTVGTTSLQACGRTLVRYRRRLGRADLVRLPSGLWVTSYRRTLVDCARLLSHEALVCVLDDALHRGLVTAADLAELVRQRASCPGVGGLRRAVGAADGRAESPAETLARLLLLPHLPLLVPQHRLLDDRGRILARFDLADPSLQLAVEADGRRGHAGERMAAKDQRRDRASLARGWRTERCTWFELRRQQQALVRRVLGAAADQAHRAA